MLGAAQVLRSVYKVSLMPTLTTNIWSKNQPENET